MVQELHQRIIEAQEKARRVAPIFQEFADAQNDILINGPHFICGSSFEEDIQQYISLVRHGELIWRSATLMCASEMYPQALFLAIATIEEVGKIGPSRFHILVRDLARRNGNCRESLKTASKPSRSFYWHKRKHFLAAVAGALINSRMDRVLGKDIVERLISDAKTGKIEKLRQSALYAEPGPSGPLLPSDLIEKDTATQYVVIAGELLAEILGFEPKEWERLLNMVQEFESSIGYPSK